MNRPRRSDRVCRSILLSALLRCASPAARALSIAPNPVPFDSGVSSGSYTLVDVAVGLPSGGVVLDGSVGASDTTLVLRMDLATGAGALGACLGVTLGAAPSDPPLPVTGAGWIPGALVDASFATISAGEYVLFTNVPESRRALSAALGLGALALVSARRRAARVR
jgi:hypothetical protein